MHSSSSRRKSVWFLSREKEGGVFTAMISTVKFKDVTNDLFGMLKYSAEKFHDVSSTAYSKLINF